MDLQKVLPEVLWKGLEVVHVHLQATYFSGKQKIVSTQVMRLGTFEQDSLVLFRDILILLCLPAKRIFAFLFGFLDSGATSAGCLRFGFFI